MITIVRCGKWRFSSGLRAMALMGAALLGGCALAAVGTEPAPDLYVLTAVTPEVPAGVADTAWQILIEEPYAPAEINTNRIVYRPDVNQLSYYADARWTDRAPQIVQRLMVETLENTGKFLSVGRRSGGLRSDFALTSDLRMFEAEPGNGLAAPKIRVKISTKLVRQRGNQIVASRVFDAEAVAQSGQMPAVVRAFDAALHQVLGEMAVWTLTEVHRVAGNGVGG